MRLSSIVLTYLCPITFVIGGSGGGEANFVRNQPLIAPYWSYGINRLSIINLSSGLSQNCFVVTCNDIKDEDPSCRGERNTGKHELCIDSIAGSHDDIPVSTISIGEFGKCCSISVEPLDALRGTHKPARHLI